MNVWIRLISLTAAELKIEPAGIKSRFASSPLLDIQQLKQQLASYNLQENEDYSVISSADSDPLNYRILFSGPSFVLRALHAIPQELILFSSKTYEGMEPMVITQQDFEQLKLKYAINLSPKTCCVQDIRIVEQAHRSLCTSLRDDIYQLHQSFALPSIIMKQLTKDMEVIAKKPDQLFNYSNFKLLMSSLCKAMRREEACPSVKDKALFNPKCSSKLLLGYLSLIRKYAEFTPSLFKKEVHSDQIQMFEPKIWSCYAHLQKWVDNETANLENGNENKGLSMAK